MHPSFRKIFDRIELQRKTTLESVSHLSVSQLNLQPAENKWSIAQILSHLIAAEGLSVQYMQKKIQGIEKAEDSGLIDEMKMLLLKISQRTPGVKFKVPRGLVALTPIHHDIDSLTKEWDRVRNEFAALLEKIPDPYINKKIYKHVRAGYLNPRHALLFFREHIIHHTPQIKRLLPQK